MFTLQLTPWEWIFFTSQKSSGEHNYNETEWSAGKNNSSTTSRGENESSVDLRESSSCVSMICQWVSRAICWLSQTAGDYNYPGAEGGEREACSVNRLPLLSCVDVARSQGPHSCTSTTLYWMWLLNLFTLGVFSLCNQYSLLLQCTAGTGIDRVTRMIQTL